MCFWPLRREIVDNHEKENALNIVTEERTYHIYAESPEDARYFLEIWCPLVVANDVIADLYFLNSL